jgi:hypothetical protein
VRSRLDVRDTPTHEETYPAIAAGSAEGATPARAGFLVPVAHGGVPRRRRGARIGQSLARCTGCCRHCKAGPRSRRRHWSPDPYRRSITEDAFGRDVVGMHAYQGRLVALIAVHAPANAPLGRHGSHEASATRLPVTAVTAGMPTAAHRLFCFWAG